MLFEEHRQRLAVAPAEPLERVVRVARRLVHEGPHTLYPRVGQEAGPEKANKPTPRGPIPSARRERAKEGRWPSTTAEGRRDQPPRRTRPEMRPMGAEEQRRFREWAERT